MIEPYEILNAEIDGDVVHLSAYCTLEKRASLAGTSPDDTLYTALCYGTVPLDVYSHPSFDYSLDCDDWEEA